MKTDMQEILEKITYILGTAKDLENIWQKTPLTIFSEETICFFEELSRCIRQRQGTEQYPDLRSFAFWCRRQNLRRLKEQYEASGREILLGRGVSLHFVPSNIPLMFAYSMVSAMLAGNGVVMRLPSKTSAQEQLLAECLKQVIEKQSFGGRIVLIRYEHREEVTRWLSERCDIRIIWGGNASVKAIRHCPLRADAAEITFADRRSATVLDADALLKLDREQAVSLAEKFFGDAYLYDQNSCASPSLVYWQGSREKVGAARRRFWNEVCRVARERYTLSGKIVMEKWEKALELAAADPEIRVEHWENQILCIQVDFWEESVWEKTMYGGFFVECQGEDLKGLLPVLNRTCQTLSYFGVEPEIIAAQIVSGRKKGDQGTGLGSRKGVDRIVPVGRALDFELIWDGMDLIRMMSRRICWQ